MSPPSDMDLRGLSPEQQAMLIGAVGDQDKFSSLTLANYMDNIGGLMKQAMKDGSDQLVPIQTSQGIIMAPVKEALSYLGTSEGHDVSRRGQNLTHKVGMGNLDVARRKQNLDERMSVYEALAKDAKATQDYASARKLNQELVRMRQQQKVLDLWEAGEISELSPAQRKILDMPLKDYSIISPEGGTESFLFDKETGQYRTIPRQRPDKQTPEQILKAQLENEKSLASLANVALDDSRKSDTNIAGRLGAAEVWNKAAPNNSSFMLISDRDGKKVEKVTLPPGITIQNVRDVAFIDSSGKELPLSMTEKYHVMKLYQDTWAKLRREPTDEEILEKLGR